MECWLAECLDITSAIECRAQYLQWLESDQPLQHNGSAVRKVDASGIQALAAFMLSVKKTGSMMECKDFSEVLSEGIELLGYELNQGKFKIQGAEMVKILAVDDSVSIRQMVSHTLKDAGYDVETATDGQDALNKS